MDPPTEWFLESHWLTNTLFDCLIWRKADNSGYVGQAASSWQQMDATTWRFHLRPNLKFQNGEALDATAVKWNLDRVRTDSTLMVAPQWQFIKSVNVVDPVTLDVLTNGPQAYFEFFISFNGCELVPPAYWQKVGSSGFAAHPIGSGPYMLTSFIANQRYVFDAWSGYWAGKPKIDEIVYQVIPDKSSQIAALLAHQVDLVYDVPTEDMQNVQSASGITTMKGPSGQVVFLRLRADTASGNMSKTYPGYNPVTEDPKVRLAISHALDRVALAKIEGNATPSLVRIPASYPEAFASEFTGDGPTTQWYNQALSKSLLQEAGYSASHKPTVYMDASNLQLGNNKDVAQAVVSMLEAVGFNVNLKLWDPTAFDANIVSPGNNRDIVQMEIGGIPALTPLLYTCAWKEPTYHICDEGWTAIGNQIETTTDPAARLQLWHQWETDYINIAQAPVLYEVNQWYAMNSKFKWTPRADGWETFRDLQLA